MLSKKERNNPRLRRKRRIRKKVFGTATRPRMSVFRSNRHVYVQLIDDVTGETLAAASTIEPDLTASLEGKKKVEQAKAIGELVGERAREKGIEAAVFDRNGYIYHGRVAAVADGAREAGLSL